MAEEPLKSATPSKKQDNQDAATLSRSQPSTSEEVQARVRRDGDLLDQSDRSSDQAVAERADSR